MRGFPGSGIQINRYLKRRTQSGKSVDSGYTALPGGECSQKLSRRPETNALKGRKGRRTVFPEQVEAPETAFFLISRRTQARRADKANMQGSPARKDKAAIRIKMGSEAEKMQSKAPALNFVGAVGVMRDFLCQLV